MFWLVEERAGVGGLASDLSSYIWISYFIFPQSTFQKMVVFFFFFFNPDSYRQHFLFRG